MSAKDKSQELNCSVIVKASGCFVDKFANSNSNGQAGDSSKPNLDTIVVTDDQGRTLDCYVERSLEIDGSDYALLLPVDVPIEIFAWEDDEDGEDSLVDLEDEEVEVVFLTARAVLAEQDMTLTQTALTLTAKGDVPVPDEDDIVTLDLSDESGDLESEDFQLLANFFHEEQEYAIYTPLNPLLIFVRLQQDGKPVLLEPEEFEGIRPQLEDQFFDEL